LVIDEVLAVGDAEFQKKAIGKMQDISKQGGRTVLFVSHNMAAVKSLCTRGIVLENGGVVFDGLTDESVQYYLNNNSGIENSKVYENLEINQVDQIKVVKIITDLQFLKHSESIKVNILLHNKMNNINVGIALLNSDKAKIFTTVYKVESKLYNFICEIPKNLLLKGSYSLDVAIFTDCKVYEYLNDICFFQVEDLENDYKIYNGKIGDLKIDCLWYENF
jgi:lipopolysaccharide transport system ATP-binding protein